MRILVTGGAGFVGCNIANRALMDGHAVLIFDNLSRAGGERNIEWLRSRFSFDLQRGDIRSRDEATAAVKLFRPDAVFHLAGQVAMTTSIASPIDDFLINAQGTLYLLEAVRSHTPNAVFVYASTNKVYGDLSQVSVRELATRYVCPDFPEGFDETVPLKFCSPYGCSKGAADQYVLDYHRLFGLRTLVFRHSSIYGGRQFSSFDQGWVGWFCSQAIRAQEGHGKDFSISGSGKQVRDLLHVEDATALYLSTLNASSGAYGEAFNIGGGMRNSLSILELLQHFEDILSTRLNFYRLPLREGDQSVFVADVAKAKRLLGWAPKVSWQDGLCEMVEWTRLMMREE